MVFDHKHLQSSKGYVLFKDSFLRTATNGRRDITTPKMYKMFKRDHQDKVWLITMDQLNKIVSYFFMK